MQQERRSGSLPDARDRGPGVSRDAGRRPSCSVGQRGVRRLEPFMRANWWLRGERNRKGCSIGCWRRTVTFRQVCMTPSESLAKFNQPLRSVGIGQQNYIADSGTDHPVAPSTGPASQSSDLSRISPPALRISLRTAHVLLAWPDRSNNSFRIRFTGCLSTLSIQ